VKKNRQSQNINVASIMRRLPLHRQFDSSQSALITLSPIWTKWANQTLTNDIATTIRLTHYKNGELTLHCDSAIAATQINQQQHRLLLFLNQELALSTNSNTNIIDVKSILVRISKSSSQPLSFSTTSKEKQTIKRQVPNQLSLNSMKSCKKMINNDQLSNSLNRLIQTVQQLEKKDSN